MVERNPFRDAILRCATETDIGDLKDLEDTIEKTFEVLATVLAARLEGWAADDENPGYLISEKKGVEIRVPWNLMPDFGSDESDAMIGLAQRLKSGQDTVICLSGSGAIRQAFSHIGDLDFCEYVRGTGFTRVVKKAAVLEDEDLICWGIKSLKTFPPVPSQSVLTRPWRPNPVKDETFLEVAAKTYVGKCDYLADTSFEGVIEVTNVVLVLGHPDAGDRAVQHSFPAQEAPLVGSGGWLPRSLTRPEAIGNYVRFLLEQARFYLEEGPVAKAVKRAFSLARLTFFSEEADEINLLFEQEKGFLVSVLRDRLSLRKHMRDCEDKAVAAFEPRLSETILQLARKLGMAEARSSELPGSPEGRDAWCEKLSQALVVDRRGERVEERIQQILDKIESEL